jgi:hypothetical protein
LNFDEITQAPMELTSPLLKVFLGGAIGDYRLPAGTVLMATGNLVSDRAGCSRLSSALRERCVVIHIEPDFNDWREWYAKQEDFNAGVLAFLEANPSLFNAWDAKKDHNQPTPRNWSRVSRILPFDPAEETIAGIIGADVAGMLMKFIRANVQVPSVMEVYNGTKAFPSSPALAARFVELVADFAAKAVGSLDVQIASRLAVDTFPADCYQVQLLKALAKRGGDALESPGFRKLVAKHRAAIVAGRKG